MTNECLKSRGKLPVDKERLTIFVMMGTRMDAQSFSKELCKSVEREHVDRGSLLDGGCFKRFRA